MSTITRESILRILIARRNCHMREFKEITRSLIRWHIEQIREEQFQEYALAVELGE